MCKSGSSHFRDPPLISEETPLRSEAVLIKYQDFWHLIDFRDMSQISEMCL